MVVVTSGSKYMDIDGYACSIAYARLLNLLEINAKAISSANLNNSITNSLRNLNTKLDNYQAKDDDKYVIVDVSNPKFFDKFVKQENVIKVIDHHVGYEEFWRDRIGENANIEFIGAAATLVFEEYEKNNMLDNMSTDVAKLLMAAILDNTLKFTAKITSNRDRVAYKRMQEIVGNKDFDKLYFHECQLQIEQNLEETIKNDIKIEKVSERLPKVFGQLTVWNKDFIIANLTKIRQMFNEIDDKWMLNLICLQDEKSYIISDDKNVQTELQKLFGSNFEGLIMPIENVMLRKEIMKKAKSI